MLPRELAWQGSFGRPSSAGKDESILLAKLRWPLTLETEVSGADYTVWSRVAMCIESVLIETMKNGC